MARLTPASYRPILQFHFHVIFSSLEEGAFVTYARGSDLPSADNNPVVIEYGNTYMHVKGKTRWNNVSMTFYSLSKPDTNDIMWKYLNKHQAVTDGTDTFKDEYMGDIQIQLLNPNETVVGTWKLINAFIANINFGSLDWSADDVVQPEITFVYDYAEWTPVQQPA